jgi:hypothetical protein
VNFEGDFGELSVNILVSVDGPNSPELSFYLFIF